MPTFYLKRDANPSGGSREIWFALGYAARLHEEMFVSPLVAVSMLDGVHPGGASHTSLHYAGKAIDIRTRELTQEQKQNFHNRLQSALAQHGFDCVAEGPPWNERAPHEHVEFDPKGGESFLLWID